MTALRAIRVLGSLRLAIRFVVPIPIIIQGMDSKVPVLSAVLLATFLVTVPKVEALDKAPVKIATRLARPCFHSLLSIMAYKERSLA